LYIPRSIEEALCPPIKDRFKLCQLQQERNIKCAHISLTGDQVGSFLIEKYIVRGCPSKIHVCDILDQASPIRLNFKYSQSLDVISIKKGTGNSPLNQKLILSSALSIVGMH